MKMKKVISISLLCLFLIALTVTSASAINAKTQDQINEWLIYERTHPTQYGGGNCVDFCNHYLTDFWGTSFMWGNANDWRCPDGFTEIDVHSDINQLNPEILFRKSMEIMGMYVCFVALKMDRQWLLTKRLVLMQLVNIINGGDRLKTRPGYTEARPILSNPE